MLAPSPSACHGLIPESSNYPFAQDKIVADYAIVKP